MLRAGTRVTTAVDVFAFGVLMWEVYTARRPHAGLSREAIAERVLRGGVPVFPPGAPAPYADLARDCWRADAAARPAMAEVAARLQAVAEAMARMAQHAPPVAPPMAMAPPAVA